MPGGEIIKPYDITSWSLPLTMGVDAIEVNTKSTKLEESIVAIENVNLYRGGTEQGDNMIFLAGDNESFKVAFTVMAGNGKVYRTNSDLKINNVRVAKGSFVIPVESKNLISQIKLNVSPLFTNDIEANMIVEVKMPSIAIVDSWFHDMDAGWTRYVFDTYNIPFKVLRPDDLADEKLIKNYQVIIFPNQNADLLTTGKRKRDEDYWPMNLPPQFAKGMGTKGKNNLLKFIDNGGKVLSWGQSVDLFLGMLTIELEKDKKEEFSLPVSDVSSTISKNGLEAIGCHVKVNSLQSSTLTYGMPSAFPIFFTGSPVFETSIPYFDTDRRVILTYPEGDPKLSGYMKNGELLENKAAMVWVKKNKGQLFLFGFNPQFRGQTSGAFKLIFNALLLE
jgi:ferredoxin-fold anticodon binding domain-containing protein